MVVVKMKLYIQSGRLLNSYVEMFRIAVLLCGLVIIAWNDGKEKRIPNEWLAALAMLRTVFLVFEIQSNEWDIVLFFFVKGMMLGGGLFLLPYLFSNGSVGAGDVKLLAVAGYYMGSPGILFIIVSAVIVATVYSVVLLILGKADKKKKIAFAPFIFVGTIFTLWKGA